jgi:hypothetical protein
MQTTESERLLLIEKKEEVCRLSLEIMDIIHQENASGDDVIEVKKRMVRILSLLYVFAGYGSPGRDLDALMRLALRFYQMQGKARDDFLAGIPVAELFCITANSIDFSYSWLPTIIKAQVPPHDILVRK